MSLYIEYYEVKTREGYEYYFMPEIFKYAIRWNKCEYSSSIDTNIKLFGDFVKTEYLELPEKD